MIKKTCLPTIIFLILIPLLSFSETTIKKYPQFSIYGGWGPATPIHPEEFRDIGRLGTNNYFGLGVRYYKLNELTFSISIANLPKDDKIEWYNGGDIEITTFMFDFRIRALKDYQRKFRKHVVASVAYSMVDFQNPYFKTYSRLSLGAGLGMEYKITAHYFLWLESKANLILGLKKANESDSYYYAGDYYCFESQHRIFLQVYAGLRYNFSIW